MHNDSLEVLDCDQRQALIRVMKMALTVGACALAVVVHNPKKRRFQYLYVSEAYAAYSGYKREEMEGCDTLDFIAEDNLEPIYAVIKKVDTGKVVKNHLTRIKMKYGGFKWSLTTQFKHSKMYFLFKHLDEHKKTRHSDDYIRNG